MVNALRIGSRWLIASLGIQAVEVGPLGGDATSYASANAATQGAHASDASGSVSQKMSPSSPME